eukprot:763906-Hanusia_phi.AAC.2
MQTRKPSADGNEGGRKDLEPEGTGAKRRGKEEEEEEGRGHDLSSETERAAYQEMLWGVSTGEDPAIDDEEAWTAGLDRLAQDASFT